MKKIILFFLIFLFLSSAYAEAEEQIVKTNITDISINTWFQDNESFYRIYFNTENKDGNSYFEKTGQGNLSGERFEISIIRTIETNITPTNILLDHLTNCNGQSCRDAFLTCDAERGNLLNLSGIEQKYVDCSEARNLITTNYREAYQSLVDLNNTYNATVTTLEQQKNNAEAGKLWWALIAGILVAVYYEYKKRFGRSRQEKQMGITSTINELQKKASDLLNKGGKYTGGGTQIIE